MLHFVSPNRNELKVIGEHLGIPVAESMDLATVTSVAERLVEHVPVVVTTLGEQGVLVRTSDSLPKSPMTRSLNFLFPQVTRRATLREPFYDERGELIASSPVSSRRYPAVKKRAERPGEILSVSGCGDCLTAGIIYGIHRNLDEIGCVKLGLEAAALSLRSFDAVPRTLRDALRRSD